MKVFKSRLLTTCSCRLEGLVKATTSGAAILPTKLVATIKMISRELAEARSNATARVGEVLQGDAQRLPVCVAIAVATADSGILAVVEGAAEADQ